MRGKAAAALMLALAACATAPAGSEEIRERGSGHRCDAAKARGVVGQRKSGSLGANALRLSGAATLRWIAPDTMVTMDYREDRLNLHTDARGKVLKVACG